MKKNVLSLQKLQAPQNSKLADSTISIFCIIKSNLSISNCLNDPPVE